MTYPTTFTPEQKVLLGEMVPTIENLRPGKGAIIEHRSPKELEKRKYLLYAWLSPFHTNKKELFSIKSLNSTSFMIIRRDVSKATVKVLNDECEMFVMDHLLDIVDEEEVMRLIHSNCTDPVMQARIFDEWKRVNGN